MVVSKLLKLCYGTIVLYGIASVLAPKRVLAVSLRLWNVGIGNVSALEPRPWYVRYTRALGAGMVVTGLVGLGLEERASEPEPEDDPAEETGDVVVELDD